MPSLAVTPLRLDANPPRSDVACGANCCEGNPALPIRRHCDVAANKPYAGDSTESKRALGISREGRAQPVPLDAASHARGEAGPLKENLVGFEWKIPWGGVKGIPTVSINQFYDYYKRN